MIALGHGNDLFFSRNNDYGLLEKFLLMDAVNRLNMENTLIKAGLNPKDPINAKNFLKKLADMPNDAVKYQAQKMMGKGPLSFSKLLPENKNYLFGTNKDTFKFFGGF